ncbi:Cyclic di-GMP phosphodiesterase Gmr [Aliarcobacter thereius]|uniref:Cyclic di-GMP phosphodiesterase Gmr n=2 Tax=Aliarcobacter thereius TaxID=544718 RepID=A0A1C0B7K1_9BACT|nr:diguanylate cyclase [Aliarcobacter thereius]OCL87870.1 Cyclic di-GMP phosphodiesterase Gmr [Aliarcobacter thereius]OCL95518.1 Cyclic di-GMP phosphodiesterase Gmr [Aliarcobacter thereius LMG 24486]OCL99570.1 Cyclic di-GMP phosphodiesterase Gmr [Aliarcobacter thereius]QBF16495.1 multi-sensor domain-containing diguanylate cyclase [Aliarcobacter thereius LMG 24486]TLS72960.1 diguanylate cyclase [Aliarcobacter thereius]
MFINRVFLKYFLILSIPFIMIFTLFLYDFSKSEIFLNKEIIIVLITISSIIFTLLVFILERVVRKEQKLYFEARKHQNIYKTLNIINKTLLKFKSKEEAFLEVSDILIKNSDISFSFIYDIETKDIISKQSPQKDFITRRSSHIDFEKESLILKVIKSGKSIIVNNLKEEKNSLFSGHTEEFNLNSLLSIPIKMFDKNVGFLIIYSKHKDFFDEDIKDIFEKLAFDITTLLETLDLKAQKKAQEDELRLTSYTFEASSVPMIITDRRNNIVKVNKAFSKIMGYSKEELLGQNPRIFKSAHQTMDKARDLWSNLLDKGHHSLEVYNKKADGSLIALKSAITILKDDDGKITNYFGQYMDISEQKDKEKVLQYQATHDNLTGLPNRLLLTDRIEHAITRTVRHKIYGGLIFIDLDNFKEVNDTLGHDLGDILLVTVAKKIKSSVREEDTVARIGGDEFIVLLDNIGNNSNDARRNIDFIARKIKDSLNSITHIEGHKNVSTPSIGITLFNDASITVQDIIKQADTAMYSAKKQGKNAIEFF